LSLNSIEQNVVFFVLLVVVEVLVGVLDHHDRLLLFLSSSSSTLEDVRTLNRRDKTSAWRFPPSRTPRPSHDDNAPAPWHARRRARGGERDPRRRGVAVMSDPDDAAGARVRPSSSSSSHPSWFFFVHLDFVRPPFRPSRPLRLRSQAARRRPTSASRCDAARSTRARSSSRPRAS
jgi:hypothetical protein